MHPGHTFTTLSRGSYTAIRKVEELRNRERMLESGCVGEQTASSSPHCLLQEFKPLEEFHRSSRPIYVSFVSKAILWDRGPRHYTAHVYSNICPPLCPRFLSHMKARPEDFRPPCFLSSTLRPQPPSQGKTHVLAAPKTQTLEGCFRFSSQGRTCGTQIGGLIAGSSDGVVPCLPLPATPPPSTTNPTPPHLYTLYPDSGRHQSESYSAAAPPSDSRPSPESKNEFQEKEQAAQPAVASVTESTELDWKLNLRPAGPERSESAASAVSHGSLSDLSRPPSSLFSRSTDLASGRSSVLSGKTFADVIDSTPGSSVCISLLHPSPVMELPLSPPPAGSSPHQFTTKTTSPPPYKLVFGQTKPFSPRPTSSIRSHSEKPASRKSAANLHKEASMDPSLNQSLESDQGLVTLTFPSATWSSCPSLQMTTPRSASGAKLTPSPPVSRLDSHRWPVLPPISPVRGRSGTAASRDSELSFSQSRVFDELEAIAPRSASCLSLDEASDSSGCSPPHTDLSPGLAALTVGCDSGNLGSLSRVQLLLLDRAEPDTLQSACGLEEDWSDLNWSSAGVLRPLTAGSIFERCDSAGKVRENKPDESEGGSWSPSSWIIDPTPSYNMFRSSSSPCPTNHKAKDMVTLWGRSTRGGSSAGRGEVTPEVTWSLREAQCVACLCVERATGDVTQLLSQGSYTDGGGHNEDESNCPGWRDHVEFADAGSRPGTLDHRNEEDTRMEERKTKAMNMLSKLQDETRRKCNSNKGCSNFEDFDFLAKYCIFSQEKLAEYKQAFEAEDGDGDGYISCLQVLLALKNIIPPELLTDEEEIYVYRILEMVDFRVTDGLVDLRLFAVIASLAQKIATMDEFMRSLICSTDFRSLEGRLFKAKQLFLFLLEEQRGEAGAQQGFISAEQLLLELKAGGIHLEQEAAIRQELQHIPPLDLLDFLAYLPLFMLIHKSVISNPLNDSSHHAD